MFEPDASYHSANVGVFDGSEQIAAMMKVFFAQYRDSRQGIELITFSAQGLIARLQVSGK